MWRLAGLEDQTSQSNQSNIAMHHAKKNTVSSKSKGEAATWGWWTARPGWCILVDRSSLERGSCLEAHPASGAVAAEMHETPVVRAALRDGGGQSGRLHGAVGATFGRWLGHCVAMQQDRLVGYQSPWCICTPPWQAKGMQ